MSSSGTPEQHKRHRGGRGGRGGGGGGGGGGGTPVIRSKEDVQFAVFVGLCVLGALFLFSALRVWSTLQGPKIDSKLTKAQQEAILAKWEPFTFAAWNDGQLGASLAALSLVCISAAMSWKRDKGKALWAAAAMLALYPLLHGFSLWMPVSIALGGVCAYGALIYSSSADRLDKVESVNAVTARVLFLVDAALLVYAEVLRLQTPDVAVSATDANTPLPPSVDPAQHRAARLSLVVAFLVVVVGTDVHAYRSLLKIGSWIWFAALCPTLGVYAGSNKNIVAVLSAVLFAAHVAVHCTFPYNVPFVQFFRKWRSDMSRVSSGMGEE